MKIIKMESRKILSSKFIILTFFIFLLINSILIIGNKNFLKHERNAVSKIAQNFGTSVDTNFQNSLETEKKNILPTINNLTKKYYSTQFKSLDEFYKSDVIYKTSVNIPDEDMNTLSYGLALVKYQNLSNSLDEYYTKLDFEKSKNNIIKTQNFNSKLESMVEKNFDKLIIRFDEILNTESYKTLTYSSTEFQYHKSLFKNISSLILFECIFLTLLITVYINKYEEEAKTNLLLSTTKRGRKLKYDKFITVLISSVIVALSISLLTYLFYFVIYDYSEFFKVPISSMFRLEDSMPYISWFDINLIEYVFLSIGMILILTLACVLLIFSISLLVKNSYICLISFFLLFGVFKVLTMGVSVNSAISFILSYTFLALINFTGYWFLVTNPLTMNPHFEIINLSINLILLTIFLIFSLKKYKKLDLHY